MNQHFVRHSNRPSVGRCHCHCHHHSNKPLELTSMTSLTVGPRPPVTHTDTLSLHYIMTRTSDRAIDACARDRASERDKTMSDETTIALIDSQPSLLRQSTTTTDKVIDAVCRRISSRLSAGWLTGWLVGWSRAPSTARACVSALH